MAKKKDRKAGEKRRAKARHKQQKKRRLKHVKYSKPAAHARGFVPNLGSADLPAPDGFRAVTPAQAVIQFGRPLLEDIDDEVDDPNKLVEIITSLWDYEISLREKTAQNELEELREDILDMMKTVLALDDEEAVEFLEAMIERKRNLFPADIQPPNTPIFFMRKELSHLVSCFNYDALDYSGDLIPADRQDRAAIDQLRTIDHYIEVGVDYDEWEDLYLAMEPALERCFERWLEAKGVSESSRNFAAHLLIFLDFIYRFEHDPVPVLKTVSADHLDEFFFDHLTSKVLAEPHLYVEFMPTVRLFYSFLNENGYLDDAVYNDIITELDEIEPDFIEALREEFG